MLLRLINRRFIIIIINLPLLKVSASVIHANTWITTHVTTSEGWKAELAWLADT